jgi:hypothetical protein
VSDIPDLSTQRFSRDDITSARRRKFLDMGRKRLGD